MYNPPSASCIEGLILCYSHLWLCDLILKYGGRSQLIFRNHFNFSYTGAKGEILTLQEPTADCRGVHLGVWPWVSEITALCFPSFAMQNPSLWRRMLVLLLPLLYTFCPLCCTPEVHPVDAICTPDCFFVPCVVLSKADFWKKNTNSWFEYFML